MFAKVTTPIVQIIAAVVVVGTATVAGVTDHITGEALTGIYAASLGYIFGVGGSVANHLITRSDTTSDTQS